MGRFGIGARVRDADGDTGVIVGKPAKGQREVKYEGNTGDKAWLNGETIPWRKKRLTLIEPPAAQEPAEAWVPEVGDRVRLLCNNCGNAEWGRAGEEGTVSSVNPGHTDAEVAFDHSGKWHAQFRDLSPIPAAGQPAGLQVEVGKFYRDTAGNKVGPIRQGIDGFPFDAAQSSSFWDADGRSQFGLDNDLVAEWIDEPFDLKAAVESGRMTVNDARQHVGLDPLPETAAPPAKFKVGDRVTPKADKLRKVAGHWEEYWQRGQGRAHADAFYVVSEASVFGLRISAKPDGDGPYWPAEFFELAGAAHSPHGAAGPSFIVARLTPAGLPRPNARPRVHTSLDAANAEAQRLADRLGDEFAVYQRVSVRDVDAGPVPKGWRVPDFNIARAKAWLSGGAGKELDQSFDWSESKQGVSFWFQQWHAPTPLGRAILRKWIAEAEANDKVAA